MPGFSEAHLNTITLIINPFICANRKRFGGLFVNKENNFGKDGVERMIQFLYKIEAERGSLYSMQTAIRPVDPLIKSSISNNPLVP